MSHIEWKGVFPALTTKFTERFQLDLSAFINNLEVQLKEGVQGIVLGGSLGEASTLTAEEKTLLTVAAVKHINGRIPVVVNIAEQSTSAAIDAARRAQQDGACGLMLLPPMRYKADARETVAYFKTVANATSLPIMIYNNPVDYGIEVTMDMFSDLAACDNIQAVKESTRDVSSVTRMRNRFGERFSILVGVDTLALEELLMGADGWVAGLVCAFPRETVAIYNLVQQERRREALEIYRWFLPLLELDTSPKLVQNIKLAEVATGLGTASVRPPRLPLVGDELDKVQNTLRVCLATRPTL